MEHLLSDHSEVDSDNSVLLPKVLLTFIIGTFISTAEETVLDVDYWATQCYQIMYGILSMNQVEEARESSKRG